MLAPPRPPAHDESEALIREARARQRKRRLGAAAFVALVAGVTVAVYSIASGGNSDTARHGRSTTAVRSTSKCGVRLAGPRVIGSGGRTVYREPVPNGEVHPNPVPSQVQCSASTIWVVWDNGAEMSQEGYVGARSLDRGRTWKLVFAERYFRVRAPHQLVTGYLGPWSLDGPSAAYFVGDCVACGFGKVSLWVTEDGGRTFHHYAVAWPKGTRSASVRVPGHRVTISAHRVQVS